MWLTLHRRLGAVEACAHDDGCVSGQPLGVADVRSLNEVTSIVGARRWYDEG
jgi:hypothetical protein